MRVGADDNKTWSRQFLFYKHLMADTSPYIKEVANSLLCYKAANEVLAVGGAERRGRSNVIEHNRYARRIVDMLYTKFQPHYAYDTGCKRIVIHYQIRLHCYQFTRFHRSPYCVR